MERRKRTAKQNNYNFVCKAHKENQLDLALKALPGVIKKYPNIIWILVCTGKQEENLKRLASELGLCINVVFLGKMYD
jgi:hypothetical protein